MTISRLRLLPLTLVCALSGLAAQGVDEATMRKQLRDARKAAGFDSADSCGVFIGINDFVDANGTVNDRLMPLRFAVDDAIDLAYAFCFDRDVVSADRTRLLLSGEPAKESSRDKLIKLVAAGAERQRATQIGIRDSIELAKSRSKQDGLLIVSFASHGITNREGHSVLLARDSRIDKPDTCLALGGLLDFVSNAKAKRRLVLVDACRDRVDRNRAGDDRYAKMYSEFREALKNAVGTVVLGSTVVGGVSFEDAELGNGVFTEFVLRGLSGVAAADPRGLVTVATLADYVDEQVRQFVLEKRADFVDSCTGITIHAEDVRVTDLPLAVNPAALEAAIARREKAASRADILRDALDFEVITGGLAQEVHDALTAAKGADAERLHERIDQLAVGGRVGREDFVAWWSSDAGAAHYLPNRSVDGGLPGVLLPGTVVLDNADTDTNDTIGQASTIDVRATFAGRVGGSDDAADYYVFTPPEDGVFAFTVQNLETGGRTSSLRGAWLLDDIGQTLGSIHHGFLTPGNGSTSQPTVVAKGKRYVIGVTPNPDHNAR